MNSFALSRFGCHWPAFLGSLAIACAGTAAARAELLFEHHQGGPFEYRSVGDRHAADFVVTEPIRVEALAGWFAGTSSDTSATIFSLDPYRGLVLGTTFQLHALPSVDHHVPPGEWIGVSGLSWDLPAGAYTLEFAGATMPLAYGYDGPLSPAPDFSDFRDYIGAELVEQLPFGARIYGRELSAVPEPSTYAVLGAFVLGVTVAVRRRRRSGELSNIGRPQPQDRRAPRTRRAGPLCSLCGLL